MLNLNPIPAPSPATPDTAAPSSNGAPADSSFAEFISAATGSPNPQPISSTTPPPRSPERTPASATSARPASRTAPTDTDSAPAKVDPPLTSDLAASEEDMTAEEADAPVEEEIQESGEAAMLLSFLASVVPPPPPCPEPSMARGQGAGADEVEMPADALSADSCDGLDVPADLPPTSAVAVLSSEAGAQSQDGAAPESDISPTLIAASVPSEVPGKKAPAGPLGARLPEVTGAPKKMSRERVPDVASSNTPPGADERLVKEIKPAGTERSGAARNEMISPRERREARSETQAKSALGRPEAARGGMDGAKGAVSLMTAEETIPMRPRNEQSLPGATVNFPIAAADSGRHATSEPGRAEGDKPPQTAPVMTAAAVVTPGRAEVGEELNPVGGLRTLERVQTQLEHAVVEFKRVGRESLTVVLRPDASTEMHLQLNLRAGAVDIEVQFRRGDFLLLNSHWNQLQQSLATQGVRLGSLQDSFAQAGSGRQGQPEPESARAFAENEAGRTPPANNHEPRRASGRVHATPRGGRSWETWA